MNKGYFETRDGYGYIVDNFGVHQLNHQPFKYDQQYCAIYDTPEYKAKERILQALRLGFVIGVHGFPPASILDYGSGNFAFLEFARTRISDCYGFDLADYPVPEGIYKTQEIGDYFDVVTFHDALEHVEHPEHVIARLNCQTIVISLPYCHLSERGIGWFEHGYPHRKPNEHLHHYNPETLSNLMRQFGWFSIATSSHEDIVRQRPGESWNILSMAFNKK